MRFTLVSGPIQSFMCVNLDYNSETCYVRKPYIIEVRKPP